MRVLKPEKEPVVRLELLDGTAFEAIGLFFTPMRDTGVPETETSFGVLEVAVNLSLAVLVEVELASDVLVLHGVNAIRLGELIRLE